MRPSSISPSLSTQSLSLLRKASIIGAVSFSVGLTVPLPLSPRMEVARRASAEELRDDCISVESRDGEKGTDAAFKVRTLCISGALALIDRAVGSVGLAGTVVVVVSMFINAMSAGADGGVGGSGDGDEGCCKELSAPSDNWSGLSRDRYDMSTTVAQPQPH